MNSDTESIFILIAAYLCGEKLTVEEEEKLQRWKEASDDNQRLYSYYQTLFEKRKLFSLWEQLRFPPLQAYARIFSNRSTVRKQLWHVLKYAAVILPILFTSLWLLFNQPSEVPLIIAQQENQQDIAPGKQKAQLLLENGETVILSDSSMAIVSHKDIQVGKGGVLQYAAGNRETKTKAVYHTLVVERGAEFQLVLPDGTKVWLNSDSELKYPNIFNKASRLVYLKGEAYFEVKRDAHQPFVVNAGACTIQVLGTAFNVSSYEEEKEIVTTLVNGKVAYTIGRRKGELAPGEQCIYAKEAKSMKVQKVDVNQYISWKNGLFVFDRIRMEDLARQIARWYNVEVLFSDPRLPDVSFTGAMERYRPVSYIIQLLNETNTIACSLEGKVLVFRKK